jgi:signal peptidase I
MTTETTSDAAEENGKKSVAERVAHEIRETALTIAVFVPFWLLFSTFVYELRSIPSESMVPALQVGDRVAVAKFVYGYNRNSVPFGLGKFFISEDKNNPLDGVWVRPPQRGDVAVFQHPSDGKVMIKRVIGLPGDTVQMRGGRLFLNGEEVPREEIRRTSYVAADSAPGLLTTATEYRETLPGEKGSHLIHEWRDSMGLDRTPLFRVPEGHVFMMGDNRDNSEDSRACSGHPGLAELTPEAWNGCSLREDRAIGYVPMDHLIGRADTVLFTLHQCRQAEGAECPAPRLWRGL